MSEPLAYFLTFHTYGSWLHGRSQGSVDYQNRRFGDPFVAADDSLERQRQSQMKYPVYLLDPTRRTVVLASIQETCGHRDWKLHAVHVRENHVHLVVSTTEHTPEKLLRDLKAYATRRLREHDLLDPQSPAWSEHGSTRYLWTEEKIERAIRYTLHEQGKPMASWPSEYDA